MSLKHEIERYGIACREAGQHHHVRHGWLGLDCPWCGVGTQGFHLGISLRTGRATCWRCGRKRMKDVLRMLRIPHDQHDRILKLIGNERVEKLPETSGVLKVPIGLGPLLPAHKRYLRSRKFDPDSLEKMWEIKGFGPVGKYAWRIYIPVIAYGRVVTWTTRASTDMVKKRYVACPAEDEAIPIKRVVYGEHYARNAVIVCEGATDVWRVGPGAVASMGLGYTAAQIRRLIEYPVRAVCFDNEEFAQHRAKELCRTLSQYPGETLQISLDAEDPGSATADEVAALRRYVFS